MDTVLSLQEQLAIVNAGLTIEWIRLGLFVAGGIVVCAVAWLAAKSWKWLRPFVRNPAFFILITVATLYGGFKPKVTWPTGITGGQAQFDTNEWTYITFPWEKRSSFPADATLTFYAVELDGDHLKFPIGTARAGDGTITFHASDFARCYTNYSFVVESDYDPGEVRIDDLSAIASKTNLAVTCKWTVPTNLVGCLAIVQYRRIDWPVNRWDTLDAVTLDLTNRYHAVGNFISRGIDRQFRIVVPDLVGSKPKLVKMMDSDAIRGQLRFKGFVDRMNAARKSRARVNEILRRKSEERKVRKLVDRQFPFVDADLKEALK